MFHFLAKLYTMLMLYYYLWLTTYTKYTSSDILCREIYLIFHGFSLSFHLMRSWEMKAYVFCNLSSNGFFSKYFWHIQKTIGEKRLQGEKSIFGRQKGFARNIQCLFQQRPDLHTLSDSGPGSPPPLPSTHHTKRGKSWRPAPRGHRHSGRQSPSLTRREQAGTGTAEKDNASHLYHSPPSSAAATPSTTPTQPPPTETKCKKATTSISPLFFAIFFKKKYNSNGKPRCETPHLQPDNFPPFPLLQGPPSLLLAPVAEAKQNTLVGGRGFGSIGAWFQIHIHTPYDSPPLRKISLSFPTLTGIILPPPSSHGDDSFSSLFGQ